MSNLLLKALMSYENRDKMIPLLDQLDEIYGEQMTAPRRAMYETTGTKDDNDPCQIEEGLYLGSCQAANDKELLKSLNVTHILTVASSLPPAHPNDFKYKIADVHDQTAINISQYLMIVSALLRKRKELVVACWFIALQENQEGMGSNSQAQEGNKKDQGYFTRTREMDQVLSARFKDQVNLGALEETVKPKEERDLDVAPTSRVPNQQVQSNAAASSLSHAKETCSTLSQGPANAEIIGEPFKPKEERKWEYDASHTYIAPNPLVQSPAPGSSMSFMTKKRNYGRMQQPSHCMTNNHANILKHRLEGVFTQMAKRRNYTTMQHSPWMAECLANFLKSEPPRATTQMALDEVSKVEGLNDTQILKAVDLLMNDQRKFDTFSGLPNRLRRTWLSMHLRDQF